MSNRGEKFLIFSLGQKEVFGIDIADVIEIRESIQYTSAPGSQYYVKGFASFRDNVITIIDVAKRFGLSECNTKITVVVFKNDLILGLDVEKVINIVELDKYDEIIQLNDLIGKNVNTCITNVIRLKDEQLVSVMDINLL